MEGDANILFFDGECGLCNRTIQFILKHEKDSTLKFSSLQSSFAEKTFAQMNDGNFGDSILFYSKGRIYSKSTAALFLIPFLKWYCKPLVVFWLIPKYLRDLIYDLIARNRKRFFKTCSITNANENNRFLV
jgi:predicted DCC family thiol-disulfide oxidoreductase YuxK